MREITDTGKFSREIIKFDSISIQGIKFVMSNPDLANQEARQAAFENAKENAEKLATAAGRKLGPLVRLVSPPREEAVKGEDGVADMPLRRGNFSVQIPIEIGLVSASAVVDTEWILE